MHEGYGLSQGHIVGRWHRSRPLSAASDIKAGSVTINCYGKGDTSTPIGGYKKSEFGRLDNGEHAHVIPQMGTI